MSVEPERFSTSWKLSESDHRRSREKSTKKPYGEQSPSETLKLMWKVHGNDIFRGNDRD